MRSIPSEKIFSLLPRWRFNWGWMGIDKSCTKAEKSLQKLSFDCYNKSSLSLTLSLALFLFPGRKKKAQQERRKKLPKPICEHTNCCNWMSRSNFHTQILRKKGGETKVPPSSAQRAGKVLFPSFFLSSFPSTKLFTPKTFPFCGEFSLLLFFPTSIGIPSRKKKGEKKASDTKKIVEVCGNALSIRCG